MYQKCPCLPVPLPLLGWILSLALSLIPGRILAGEPVVELIPNGTFEADADSDEWPDGWARVEPDGSWVTENGNHFLRLKSPRPGAMVMLYQEIPLPKGVGALALSWKQRITGLRVGAQSWFDARILLEFLNAGREKQGPAPAAPSAGKDSQGWMEKEVRFLVPESARTLKFMPCLFQVEAGQMDVDDVVLRPVDPAPIREAAKAAAMARQAKENLAAQNRREKAAALLKASGSLISNGGFETDRKADGWPDDWGRVKEGGSWPEEEGTHFLRLVSPAPGKHIMAYRIIDLPAGTAALELTWRQRITGLKKGQSPWFDARIMLEFQGTDGKSLSQKPPPAYSQKDTAGWVDRSHRFLVPEGALSVVMMPSLFQVEAGTFDLDDFVLKPADPAPLIAEARKREQEIQAMHVPDEAPDQAKWPAPLRVVRNRLQDPGGKEVWLQGVNAGGLETLPQDRQPVKSVVVAIDDWKSNCVRVPMNEAFWYGKSPYQKDGGADYRATMDKIITLAANRGAYVVVDLHRFRAPTAEHAAFWKDCAKRYQNHPAVLFDLFNEPHDISWEVWKNGGFVGEKEGADESAFLSEAEKKKNQGFESVGMQGLLEAVRSTGARNIVIAGGLFWCNDLSGITRGYALEDTSGNGIMYSWHTYNWHTDWEAKVLATAAVHPIFLGEVGADIQKMDFIPSEAQEDPYTWVPDMLGFVQKHHLNWTGWCLHPKATPVMISDWSYTPTPYWGVFAKEALAGRQFELKRTR